MPFAAVALLAAPQAAAKRPVDRDYPITADRKQAERTLQLYADCLVERPAMKPKINQFLRTPRGAPEFSPRAMGLVDASCAPRADSGYQLRIDPGLMQSALYSALYRRQFGKTPGEVANRAAYDLATEYDAPAGGMPTETVALRALGDCVVRDNPAASRDVVLSRSGSDTEQAAITMLVPEVQKCVPQNTTLRFSRSMLRGTVAEALYKLSVAPAATPPATAPGGAK